MKLIARVKLWSQVLIGVAAWIVIVPLLSLGGALLARLARLSSLAGIRESRTDERSADRTSPAAGLGSAAETSRPGRRAA